MAKQTEKKQKFHLPLSAYISYLLIITLVLSGISLARYTSTSSDVDVARIAVFSVSATAKTGQHSLLVLDSAEGNSGEYVFEVRNDSEIATKYTVSVKNLPANVNVRMGSQTVTSNEENDTVEFDAINLGVGDADTCTLAFIALENAPSGTFSGVSVDVQFEQID